MEDEAWLLPRVEVVDGRSVVVDGELMDRVERDSGGRATGAGGARRDGMSVSG
jgi:hypothetical protein